MRSRDEDMAKRDAETTGYFNESDERWSKRQGLERQDLEEQRLAEDEEEQEQEEQEPKEQSEEDEDEDEDAELEGLGRKDEEPESFDPDNVAQNTVERDEEVEQELVESSSGSWESGDEDDDLYQHSVTVVKETTTDIPVSHFSTVLDTDRRHRQPSTKTPLQGQPATAVSQRTCLSWSALATTTETKR